MNDRAVVVERSNALVLSHRLVDTRAQGRGFKSRSSRKIYNLFFGMPRQETISIFGRKGWECMEIQIDGMDRWMSPPVEWFHGVTLRWQLPILQRWRLLINGMDRWMSPPVGCQCSNGSNFALAASHTPKMKTFYAFSSGIWKRRWQLPNPPTEVQKRTI